MAAMLRKRYHEKGNCEYGCCPSDSREKKKQRRTARRVEKRAWRKELS